MGLYDDYATRDEALAALGSALAERDGRWRLVDAERDEERERLEAARSEARRARRQSEELKARLDRTERERDDAVARLERAGATNDAGAPNRRAEEARTRIAALEAELAPLREENARYKEREARREIEKQLVDAARRLDCCETAMRDVKRLAPMFRLNEEGLAVAEDSRLAADVLRDEIALAPHWLNRSRGADASPGSERDAYDAAGRFQDAMRRGDFADVVRFAPRVAR